MFFITKILKINLLMRILDSAYKYRIYSLYLYYFILLYTNVDTRRHIILTQLIIDNILLSIFFIIIFINHFII